MSAQRPRVAVVDYGMGNRRSVQKALQHAGAEAAITRDHAELQAADGLVVPGVGAFPQAMANLRDLGLDSLIAQQAAGGTPVLGVCLGMQLLFDASQELVPFTGLGLIAGEVTPLATGGRRVPHIGWNEVRFERRCELTEGLPPRGCAFYHVHSLAVRPAMWSPPPSTASASPPSSSVATCSASSSTPRSPQGTGCGCSPTSCR